ncbi:hypothetical protein A5720_28295 [Mycolicibacterium conceptionense]|uniref:Uncharacterized protein n=2 Tax=Mycolicibacterium conceptionense TaxID=451644 RepID=A0A1A1YKA7_9MYCO|nr:hypothetical protein A5726_24750 [Mycolicibacterium conceptionense]OBF31733.1 hypothetical protein A5720_28295 [Mycolicibacterium conceptionense]OBH96993.1 hypothetical protein A5716_16630 [Mycolicibacterium conceptionense]
MTQWGPAILSAGVLGVIPLIIAIMNRRHTKAMATQLEKAGEKEEAERENLLADATAKWSTLLDQTRTEAYKEIDKRCRRCENELSKRDEMLDRVIDAITELIPLVPADAAETESARAAVRAARRARYSYEDD